ncbi:MAG: GH3 auxin-responsive promoter family protein [Candidatus Omnitrophica bacterium]|nr:GH3 auxin-responsive promoter family protein [Candidatus Omnitrophota bacterium]
MNIRSLLFKKILLKRSKPLLERFRSLEACIKVQEETLLELIQYASRTRFGMDHHFSSIRNISDYQKTVRLRKYEDFFDEYFLPASREAAARLKIEYNPIHTSPYLNDVTWPGLVSFFALSSGTTSGTTKFLPLTRELMFSNYQASVDLITFRFMKNPETKILDGKTFLLGGSVSLREDWNGEVKSGDLSGILAAKLPRFARGIYFPGKEIAAISSWEEKIERTAEAALKEDIGVIGGVPSWVLIFLEKLNQKVAVKGDFKKLWPSFELFVHGGISFEPYQTQFESWFGPDVDYQEVYPASESFIAIEDPVDHELRLMVHYGTFYEFVPVSELGSSSPKRLTLAEVEVGQNYAIALTTNGGLWSYLLGDTIRFISKDPPLIKITGRTKFFLSAFGEHLIQEEIETALGKACQAYQALLIDFHVAPFFPDGKETLGYHQFLIEFERTPSDLKAFIRVYDEVLQALNEDYAAHRTGGFGLGSPEFTIVPKGFFVGWMKAKGKIGGQHKVPRISGDRNLLNDMFRFLSGKQGS